MITYVSGDILLSKAAVLAHGVAPNDNFHQGLALALREMWPSLYKDFRHFCKTRNPKVGTLWMWVGADGRQIVNLFTQEAAHGQGDNPGKAKTEYVNHALRDLHKLAMKEGFESIALPKLATGVGGLSWEDVEPLLEHHLGELEIPVIVYREYHAGVKAKEPQLACAD